VRQLVRKLLLVGLVLSILLVLVPSSSILAAVPTVVTYNADVSGIE